MKCHVCNEAKNLRINTDNCKLCIDCFKEEAEKHDLQNDSLFFIRENSDRAGYKALSMKCESAYDESEISAAKKYLLDNVVSQLNEIDDVLAKEVSTKRIESRSRPKAVAEISDIYNVLDVLGLGIRVTAVDSTRISLINPESLLPDSVVQRVNTQEN